ncbi:hypothetical protein [Anaeromyxobacter oryzae]|uniref:Uncharacterized protein n=1 Tax=Anaeromyxobacter oryzae TaxID=2918170 RepID=A0ABN6MNC6_9BACT|nr:hypothetical protein [Anaeromyxobacter oryzae]BDG02511.1 hypothetical protein AMOR_15070 [Anaeromyxobacter oryzae]
MKDFSVSELARWTSLLLGIGLALVYLKTSTAMKSATCGTVATTTPSASEIQTQRSSRKLGPIASG